MIIFSMIALKLLHLSQRDCCSSMIIQLPQMYMKVIFKIPIGHLRGCLVTDITGIYQRNKVFTNVD